MKKAIETLEQSRRFPDSEEIEDPSVLLWSYYFYANFLDGIGRTVEALQYIDRAVSHTPTVVDLYLSRGRMYRRAGDVLRASYWANYARELDLADRYLNVKCTKFFLRADNPGKVCFGSQ